MTARISHVRTLLMEPRTSLRATGHPQTTKARHGTVEINVRNPGTMVAHITTEPSTFSKFDYVETMEPLSVYKC
jgi:acyl-coenzyme A thioesterase PaaI-like protein